MLEESCNQVHCYLLKGKGVFVGDYVVEWCTLFVCEDFVLLACSTSFNIIHDLLIHPCPLCMGFSFLNSFILSQMSCCGMIVDNGHDRSLLCFIKLFFHMHYVNKVFRWDDWHASVVIFTLVNTKWSGECVCRDVFLARYVLNEAVVFLQICVPSCSSSVEVFRGFPVL